VKWMMLLGKSSISHTGGYPYREGDEEGSNR
jgi:hypothetical protein